MKNKRWFSLVECTDTGYWVENYASEFLSPCVRKLRAFRKTKPGKVFAIQAWGKDAEKYHIQLLKINDPVLI